MSDSPNKQSGHISLFVVVLTVLVTMALAGSAAWYAGLLAPPAGERPLARETGETLYTCGMHPQIIRDEPGNCPICGMKLVPKREEKQEPESRSGQRKVAYWRAPMNPDEIYDEPGKSAMGMELTPVYEDELVGGVNISIDPVMEQNMGIRTQTAQKGPLVHTIRTYGHVTYDETRIARVNLRFAGWIEKLHADYTGMKVKKKDPLFDVYSPELITAQQDLLEAKRNFNRRPDENSRNVLESVKSRLVYYGIAETEIDKILEQNRVRRAITVRAPYSGVVTKKNAMDGDFVQAGTMIYEIADLSTVWVEAHIYEYELSRVKKGQAAEMTLPYLPGKTYTGEVAYIYPYLQRKTRDVVVRLEFANPETALKPEMYGDVRIETDAGLHGVRIPDSAVLRSGRRNIVFIRSSPGRFIPREVELGMPLDNDQIHVAKGIAPGDEVVISGQFMLDSESRLRESTLKMTERKTLSQKSETKKSPDTEDDFFSDLKDGQGEDSFFEDLE